MFITKIRELIIANTSIEKAYSPDLVPDGDNICCVTALGGSITNNLCNEVEYTNNTIRVLIRGTENDKTTRALAFEIYNYLHLLKNISYTGGYIINIVASSTPIFVGRDENNNILYNITFNVLVK